MFVHKRIFTIIQTKIKGIILLGYWFYVRLEFSLTEIRLP